MSDELKNARAELSAFSAARPMLLHPAQYADMKAEPGLADMMDRVRVIKPLPAPPEALPTLPGDGI